MIITAGCIGQSGAGVGVKSTGAMDIRLSAEPDRIRSDEQTTIFADAENRDATNFTAISVEVFETGLLQVFDPPGGCVGFLEELAPLQIESLECKARVANPSALLQKEQRTQIRFRVTFTKELRDTVVLNLLSLDEWRRQQTLARVTEQPQSYERSDRNAKMSIDFGKAPPFVEGEKILFNVGFSNAGSGDLTKIESFQARFQDQVLCTLTAPLPSYRGVFPPVPCSFDASALLAGQPAATLPIDFELKYTYEARREVPVTIIRK